MAFRRLQTGDPELDDVGQDVEAAFVATQRSVLAGAQLTTAVALTTSYQNVGHGLGRAAYWVPVAANAPANISEDPVASNNPDPKRFIRVKASAAVTCRFLVF